MDLQPRSLTLNPATLNGLSEKLIVSHHANNYTGAVKRLGAIRQQLTQLDWPTAPVFVINGLKREELIAANSAWLHELYFDSLGGDGALLESGLAVALAREFGSTDRWRAEFTALAKAMGGGSGWALLSWSSREARLITHWAADHTHLLAGATPLLALDMYEHAYHMDFGAKAAAYVDVFMQNIRWGAVMQRYATAVETDARPWSVSPQEVRGSQQLVDVRRTAGYEQAPDRLARAVWRDPALLADWSSELDASKPVVVYCVQGHEVSQSVALALRARGLDARFVVGGIEACRAVGVAFEKKE
ncbi:Fe-Mn family superoxide dismutase [Hydrogenophaga sp. PML113]|uniref:Fe-Mn family superoxide dismutase n=1 Tax=Hydrogenophaga sp. PML113 TaxID=1899350 RepID=UPI00087917DF|nr:Fe-Mn family superoxide dismutase [Hydrogenophaga sp. PML113]